jgi:hypothetical protein
MIIPDPETLLYAGDEVIVLAMVESERAIQTILVGDTPPGAPPPTPIPPVEHAPTGVAATSL